MTRQQSNRLNIGDIIKVTNLTDVDDPENLTLGEKYVVLNVVNRYDDCYVYVLGDQGRHWIVDADQMELI